MHLFAPIHLNYKHNPNHSGRIIVMFNEQDNRIPLKNTVKGVVSQTYAEGLEKQKALVRDAC